MKLHVLSFLFFSFFFFFFFFLLENSLTGEAKQTYYFQYCLLYISENSPRLSQNLKSGKVEETSDVFSRFDLLLLIVLALLPWKSSIFSEVCMYVRVECMHKTQCMSSFSSSTSSYFYGMFL